MIGIAGEPFSVKVYYSADDYAREHERYSNDNDGNDGHDVYAVVLYVFGRHVAGERAEFGVEVFYLRILFGRVERAYDFNTRARCERYRQGQIFAVDKLERRRGLLPLYEIISALYAGLINVGS